MFEDILNGLIGYYNGPLTTDFWSGSFYQEIQNQFTNFDGDNGAAATNLQVATMPPRILTSFEVAAFLWNLL